MSSYQATRLEHSWVAENRDALLSLPPPDDLPAQSRQRSRSLGRPRSKAIAKAGAILRGASWAEAQSDDETDRQLQQAYGRRHRAKAPGATRPRGATPRGEGDAQASGSASASAGAATPHGNVRSEVADAREYLNAQSFARDAQRTSPLQDIARCQPPSLIWRSGDFELWLGGVHHVLDRNGANVRHYTILVDCLGDVHQRAFDPAWFANTSWVEVPWNYREGRMRYFIEFLDHLDVLRRQPSGVRMFCFCKRGERRSAAVLAVTLMCYFGFTANAAKAQIEDRRSGSNGRAQNTSFTSFAS